MDPNCPKHPKQRMVKIGLPGDDWTVCPACDQDRTGLSWDDPVDYKATAFKMTQERNQLALENERLRDELAVANRFIDSMAVSHEASDKACLEARSENDRLRGALKEAEDHHDWLTATQARRVKRLNALWQAANKKGGTRSDLGNLAEWASTEIERLRESEITWKNKAWDAAKLVVEQGEGIERQRAALTWLASEYAKLLYGVDDVLPKTAIEWMDEALAMVDDQ